MKTKICKYCQKELPATKEFFHKVRNQFKSYLTVGCKDCIYGNGHLKKNIKESNNIKIEITKKISKTQQCINLLKEYPNLEINTKIIKDIAKKVKCHFGTAWKAKEKYIKRIESEKEKNKITPKKIEQKKEKVILEQSLNGLNGDFKAIEKYKKLAEEVCILMRNNRIQKYGVSAKSLILELMSACHKHLSNELRDSDLNKKEVDLYEQKKEVINVDWK